MIEVRKKGQVFTDAEWIVTVRLEQNGRLLGESLPLRYADAYVAGQPLEVGRLIATAMYEMATRLKGNAR